MKDAVVESESNPSDLPIVSARESFERFYRREYRSVLAIAHVLTGNPSSAEELAQDAFAAAYQKWSSIETPEGWVRTVVANKAKSSLRRRYAEVRALVRLGPARDISIDDMPSETSHFWAEVRRLPARQAQALVLFYLEDRSTAQIAEVLGCSESTARVHLSKGRRALADRMGMEAS